MTDLGGKKPIRVLLLEDMRTDADLAVRELKRSGLRTQARVTSTEAGFRKELAEFAPDVILSDFSMPGFDGMFALSLARELCPDVPFIFVSGTIGEEYAIRALHSGAVDYVLKSNLLRLPAAVERALQDAREHAQLRRVERALQQSEAGLRRAQAMADLAHVVTAPDGAFESWSDSLPTLIGVSAAQMPASTRAWMELLHPEDRATFRATSIEAGRRETRMSVDYRLQRKDGAWIHVRQVMEPLAGGPHAGGETRWFNTLQDVTAQQQAAEALRASEERYRATFEQAAVGIVHTSLDGSMQIVNPKICELSGYTRAELIQRNFRDIVHAGDVEQCLAGRERMLSGDATPYESELRLLRKAQTPLWVGVTTSLVRARDGNPLHFISVLHDISERKRAEYDLQRFGLAMDVSADSIYLTDPKAMRFVYLNTTACKRLGYSREELLKLGPQDVLPVDRAQIEREYEQVIAAGENGIIHERPFVRSDGSRGWTELHRRALRIDEDVLIVTIGRDTTERKQADERIRRLNRIYAVLSGINAAIVRANDRSELLQAACRIAVELGGFGIAQILLVDEDAFEVWPGPSAGIDALPVAHSSFRPGAETISTQGTTIRAIRERRAVFTNDITAEPPIGALRVEALRRGYGSVLSLPLMLGDRVAAVLLLCAKERNFFDDQELRLLGELAGDIAFALDHLEKADRLRIEAAERLRVEAKVTHLNRVYAVLSGINATIVRVHTKEDLFREACRVAVENGQFRMAWLGVVDRQAKQITPIAWQGTDPEYVKRMPLGLDDLYEHGRGLAGSAVRDREAVVVDDMTKDPRVMLKAEAMARGFHSLVMLPLIVSDEAVGVLALYASEIGFFDDEEMKLLRELAGDIAFALDHIEKQEKLDYLAYYDQLTGLANRTLFLERLGQSIGAARQRDAKFALAILDIERLRSVNESLGRQSGDALIKLVAERLEATGGVDSVSRISADHFALVLGTVKGRSEAGRLVTGVLRQCFGAPFQVAETELRIAAKSGVALFPGDGTEAEMLLRNAEAALRRGKDGGDQVTFHAPEMTARLAESLSLENKLRQALEKDEFVLHYQPKVDLETRRIVGTEALIRWNSPERGLVPPGQFIPLLEETGMILQVGAWALRRAVRDHGQWLQDGIQAPRIAVNVSAIQLRQRDFVDVVKQAIAGGANPTAIDLEITESLLMDDLPGNIAKLKALRELGMKISIDDFGTGYSSLGYLAKLPVHTLKIDRSFIITMLNDPDTMTLVQTIISLAHSLRLSVVAEGVEQEDQAKMLRLLRCDQIQGYLIGRPVPMAELTPLLLGG